MMEQSLARDQIIQGDALTVLRTLPDNAVQCCITSPPYYGLRDYQIEGQIGLETTPAEYVQKLVEVFREVRRVLSDDGTLWLNLGDTYANDKKWGGHPSGKHRKALHVMTRPRRYTGLPGKNLLGIPWRVAFGLQDDGWYLRSDIIWHKPNCMPETVTDRPTKVHEYLFLLSKSEQYFYNAEAIKEDVTGNAHSRGKGTHPKTSPAGSGVKANSSFERACVDLVTSRNKRSVWTVPLQPFHEGHFATFPPKLIEPCVLAGSGHGQIILDPFMGAGTVALVALQHDRHYLGVELNPGYIALAEKRIRFVQSPLWKEGVS